MSYDILNQDLSGPVKKIIQFYRNKGFAKFKIEQPLSDSYQYRPTISFYGKYRVLTIVEVTTNPVFQQYFEDFVKDCLVNRENFEIYLAFPKITENKEISFTHSFETTAKKYGIGIILVDGNNVIIYTKAIKCHMRITKNELDTAKYCEQQIFQIVDKFNDGRCVDAIRDITELVEKEVRKLAIKAAIKRKIVPVAREINSSFDLERLINLLSAPNWNNSQGHSKKQTRFFDESLKDDLKSYKGIRNLSHHPRNRKEEKQLEDQFLERMRMGVRLVQYVCAKKM